MKNKADVNGEGENGATPLRCALDYHKIVRLLVESGADPNATTDDGDTVLLLAAKENHTEAIITLLDNGASVNMSDRVGVTPLMIASYYGHCDAARALLDGGADPLKKENDGLNALMFALKEDPRTMIPCLLDADRKLLDAQTMRGDTALMIASQKRLARSGAYTAREWCKRERP